MKGLMAQFVFAVALVASVPFAAYADDSDHDTLPDDWETNHGRNPHKADYSTVNSGEWTICAVDDAGVQCWGDNYDASIEPVLKHPFQVSSGGSHMCAIDDDGVHCWGQENSYGQLTVPTLLNPRQVAAGYYHTCALDDVGVHCWGRNDYHQADVPALVNPVEVATRAYFTCALDDNGVHCWGEGANGETDVPELSNPVHISVGFWSACAIDDGGVQCWGSNAYGATDVPALQHPTQVSVGTHYACALDDTGVKCWGTGYDDWGQTDVPVLINPTQISAGYIDTCALDERGVRCWGAHGQSSVPNLDIDPDIDHMPSDWEMQYGFDRLDNSNEFADPDADGFTNVQEYKNGTNPLKAERDSDGDGLYDAFDNCPKKRNANQSDIDGDGIGDVCDTDMDGDGVQNNQDKFPTNPSLAGDSDKDGIDTLVDNCPRKRNFDQSDIDSDGLGDACDTDIDGDGVRNGRDKYPLDAARW